MRFTLKPIFVLLSLFVVLTVVRADNAEVEPWVSSGVGAMKVSSLDGAFTESVADAGLYPVIAVDSVTRNVWTYSEGALRAFDPAGDLLLSTAIPDISPSYSPVMTVDGVNGYVALGLGRSLRWFDLAGNPLDSVELSADITTLAIDSARNVLWIGATHLYKSHSRGMPVPSNLGNVWQDARRVAFDPISDVLWVLRYDGIERHDITDGSSASFPFPTDKYVRHIAADGSGGLWLADDNALYRLSGDGSYGPEIRIFAGPQSYWWWGTMTVLDVVADPLDGSVWVVGDRMIRHYSAAGKLISELHSELPDGTRPRLTALAYAADVHSPVLNIISPGDGDVIAENRPDIQLSYVDVGGNVSPESVAIYVDDQLAASACNATDNSATCRPETPLEDGEHRLGAEISDASGNVTSAQVATVRIDTATPAPLLPSSIQIARAGEAWQVAGAAGAVEAGARVTIRNTRTGETVSVVAVADGSFAATVHGESSDVLAFVVTDAAGNTSDAFEMPVTSLSTMAFQQMAAIDYDPQTALMTVVEPELEADTTSASPLGDDYDPVFGSVTFSVTDISIPGNFAIPVELRRWVPTDDYATGGPTGWAWNIPFIRGNYLDLKDGHVDYGWDWGGSNTWHFGANCSGSAGSAVSDQGELIAGNAYWQGKLLHIPGVTSETFLETSEGEQVTKSNFRIASCINNASGQQGIVVAGPNGLTYTFNHIKSYYNGKFAFKDPIVRTRLLMVTKIEDRFGNHVDYSYTNGELTQISASDGRKITINYETVSGKRRPITAVAHGRTWTYAYQGSSATDKLLRVTLPDGVSMWEYDNVSVVAFNPNFIAGYNQRIQIGGGQTTYIPGCTVAAGQYTATVKTPWGLTSTYTFEDKVHYRSDVEPDIYHDVYMEDYALSRALNCTVKRSLITKSIAGPGVSTANWTYTYSTNKGTYTDSSGLNGFLTGPFELPVPVGGYPAPITSGTAADYRSTTVTGPDRTVVFYIDRKFQSLTENRVVAQDTRNVASTELLRRTQNTFALGAYVGMHWYMCPCDGMYPPVNEEQLSYRINQTQAIEKRYLSDGTDTYTSSFSDFDPYGFYLNLHESNSLGYQRTIARTFKHDTANGLIGLPLTESINGITVVENHYNSLGQLDSTKSFGKLQASLTYDNAASVASGQRGTLKTVTDGNNNISTLSNWKRGTPQLVQFADGSSRSGTVNDSGWLMSTTDENGYITSYTYDDMGQLASITYPMGDSTDWAVTTRSVVPVASSEYGIGAGHWRVTVATGNARKITYYDALLRPLLTREYDAADQANTQRFQHFTYDLDGRVTFASFPGSPYDDTGTWTAYDVLGRPTSITQDSELGTLTTAYSYLNNARIQVTNPRNKTTTTTYMAYGQPTTQWPVLIDHPEGAYTHIARDLFGKPTQIRRSNSSLPTGGNVFVNRTYTYNTNQELCRSVEPETGATLIGYDGAGNLKWSAAGLASATACEPGGSSTAIAARRVDRTYDARNRLATLTFPDGRGDQAWTYTPDGLPAQITTDNASSGELVVNSYAYNKRRLPTVEAMIQPGQAALVSGYDYDQNGALASISYPSGRIVTFAPNALGQPTKAGGYASDAIYYPNGALKQFTYGNGIVHTMIQNARQLPDRSTDGTVLDLATTYDANGNVATITDHTIDARQTRTMTYDALDRLTGTISPMFGTASYSYDVLDNLRHIQVTGGSNPRNHDYCYVDNQLNTIMTGGCGGTEVLALTYDAQGNLFTQGPQAYAFDYGNRLREATGLESYRYDAHGRRVYAHTSGGDIYSLYGQDGVLRHMDNRRTNEQTDYIYLGGSLVTEAANEIAAIAAPTLTVPPANATGSYTVSWTTVATATLYELQERQVDSNGWTPVAASGATSEPISGKDTGTYAYRVRACIADDCGLWSTPASTVVTLPLPAAAPTLTVPPTSSTGNYTVSWTTVPMAFTYKLEEKVGDGNWSLIQANAATSKPRNGKKPGPYSYRVSACNGTGCGPASDIKTVTLPPTGVPTLTVPPTDSTGSFAVSWTAVTAATSYELEEKIGSGNWSPAYSGSAQSDVRSSEGVRTYSYRVRACNAGGCGHDSTVKSVAVSVPPAIPAFTSLTLTKPSGKRWVYAMSWTSPAHATTYELWGPQYDSLYDQVEIYAGPNTSYSYEIFDINEPTAGFNVRACNSAGCSGFSAIEAPLGVPNLTVPFTNNDGSYTVSWTVASGATSYKLEERANGGSWSEIQSGSAMSKAFSGKGTATYSYRVRACNADGCGSYSAIESVAVTRPPVAPAITSLTLTKPSGKRWDYVVGWTSSAHATRYELWGPNFESLHDSVKIYDGPNTSFTHYIFNIDEPTEGFRVRACNSGGCSAFSSTEFPLGVSTLTAPATNTSGSYTVSWTAASAATSYRLEERVNSGSWSQIYSGSSRSKARSGKSTGTYSYRVRACNADGCGSYSAIKSVSVTRIPATPTFTTATVSHPSGRRWDYNFAWTSSVGATHYELRGPDYAHLSSQVLIYSGPNTSYAHGIFSFDGEPGSGFSVRACNSNGCSGQSALIHPQP